MLKNVTFLQVAYFSELLSILRMQWRRSQRLPVSDSFTVASEFSAECVLSVDFMQSQLLVGRHSR